NKYAGQTYNIAISRPQAHVHDPKDNPNGPDPNCQVLGKPPELPWAVVPLVITGSVFGQIVVANIHSRAPTTQELLQFLDAVGSIAAGVIASARRLKLLSAPNLPILYSSLSERDPERIILLRLLVYLTCGEALGFTRALFYRLDPEARRLAYAAGIG